MLTSTAFLLGLRSAPLLFVVANCGFARGELQHHALSVSACASCCLQPDLIEMSICSLMSKVTLPLTLSCTEARGIDQVPAGSVTTIAEGAC